MKKTIKVILGITFSIGVLLTCYSIPYWIGYFVYSHTVSWELFESFGTSIFDYWIRGFISIVIPISIIGLFCIIMGMFYLLILWGLSVMERLIDKKPGKFTRLLNDLNKP